MAKADVIDLIIPTIQGREDSLARCRESFEQNTYESNGHRLNVIVVPDSKTCGWGWQQGLMASDAPYVALVADDIECRSGYWAEVCIDTVDMDFIPCPRVFTPDGRIESQGGDMHAFGHILQRPRRNESLCDFTTVPFLSRQQADEIGMIGTQYACDVWASYRGRQLGYDTILRHGYDLIHHQHPVGRGAGMSQNERDALDTQTMFTELAYASHTPHLRQVLAEVQPKRVLEIGAGLYSTPEFLRCESVEDVDSLETDEDWAKRVRQRVGPDGRLSIWVMPDPSEWRDVYDLIFVDGPDTEAERMDVIHSVLTRDHPVVVIHDAEHPPYRTLIDTLTNGNVEYLGEGRQTAVVR